MSISNQFIFVRVSISLLSISTEPQEIYFVCSTYALQIDHENVSYIMNRKIPFVDCKSVFLLSVNPNIPPVIAHVS